MIFQNREQAGAALADLLYPDLKNSDAIVIALPRGGVPVAAPIAKRLDTKLDILIVRKIGAPYNPEFALGAVTEDGNVWMNQDTLEMIPQEKHLLDDSIKNSIAEMKRQGRIFRSNHPQQSVKNRTVILVDDGLATGATLIAAATSLKKDGAAHLIIAVPVASQKGMNLLRPYAERIYAVEQPAHFRAVGDWYEDFSQTSDTEVSMLLAESRGEMPKHYVRRRDVVLNLEGIELSGELSSPDQCRAWIVFAHGSGSSRKSPRNLKVARYLNERGFGTLLFDLLTERESADRKNTFDIDLLSSRLVSATHWMKWQSEWNNLPVGYFGASTGAAAAIQAATEFPELVFGVVSRGGRPDLAKHYLEKVSAPVLMIVGEEDREVLELNRQAYEKIPYAQLETVPHATHLFEEPGTLESVMRLAHDWFRDCLLRYRKGRHEVA